jgi:hypothetical protein
VSFLRVAALGLGSEKPRLRVLDCQIFLRAGKTTLVQEGTGG